MLPTRMRSAGAPFEGVRRALLEDVPRTAAVSARTGLLWEALSPAAPAMLRRIARDGLNVRTLHALYARAHPHRLALADAHRRVSYAELDEEIDRVARGLRVRLGVRRGHPVLLMMENRAEYAAAWFALFRLRTAAVHAPPRLTRDELAHEVERSGARVLLVSDEGLEAALGLAADRPGLGLRVVRVGDGGLVRGALPYRELLAGPAPPFTRPERRGGGHGGNVVFTSGTTGRPKGAMRDFDRFGVLELSRVLERLPFHTGERHLVVAPLHHSAAQVFTLVETALGASVYLRPRFEAEDALAALSGEAIHSVFMVPTMIRRVLDLPDAVLARHPTPGLRALVSGAAPFPAELRRRAMAHFGDEVVYDFYGATELGWVTLIGGRELHRRPTSVGRPLGGQEVQIRDEAGRVLGPEQVGRIWVRNAQVISGFLDGEDAAPRDGWLSVDDLGRLDRDGYLHLVGRAREMVISGGVNLYPAEIEHVLAEHPGVREVAIVGLPDPDWGERLAAVVVRGAGPLDEAELAAWARARLSREKVPRQWVWVERLPRTETGKVRKDRLVARLSGAAA